MTEYVFSPTQMNMFSGCAAAYYQRYICGFKTPPRVALLIGTGLHGGADLNLRQKIETRKDLPMSDVKDAAAAAFDKRLEADGVFMTDEESGRKDQILGESKDKTVQMVGVFHESASPMIQPVAVEEEVSFTRDTLPDVVFHGRLDVIEENDNVLDIKSSKARWPEGKAENELQPSFYLPGASELGKKPKYFVYHVITKAKTPVHQVVTTTRDESDLSALDQRARVMKACIEVGLFPPCEPDHWRCSPKWCGYFMTCKFRSERDKNKYFSAA